MMFSFDTDQHHEAVAALLVYAVYRSRDKTRYKATPDMWDQIARFVKAAAKRAGTLPEFLESLMPRLSCGALHPRAMEVGIKGAIPLIENSHGELIEVAPEANQREFLTAVLADADAPAVLRSLYRETGFIVLLVRDRLERERVIEARFDTVLAEMS